MSETERMLLDKRDALRARHLEATKLANRIISQLGDLRSEAAFLAADLELVESLVHQLRALQDEAVGLKRDIKDLTSRAISE